MSKSVINHTGNTLKYFAAFALTGAAICLSRRPLLKIGGKALEVSKGAIGATYELAARNGGISTPLAAGALTGTASLLAQTGFKLTKIKLDEDNQDKVILGMLASHVITTLALTVLCTKVVLDKSGSHPITTGKSIMIGIAACITELVSILGLYEANHHWRLKILDQDDEALYSRKNILITSAAACLGTAVAIGLPVFAIRVIGAYGEHIAGAKAILPAAVVIAPTYAITKALVEESETPGSSNFSKQQPYDEEHLLEEKPHFSQASALKKYAPLLTSLVTGILLTPSLSSLVLKERVSYKVSTGITISALLYPLGLILKKQIDSSSFFKNNGGDKDDIPYQPYSSGQSWGDTFDSKNNEYAPPFQNQPNGQFPFGFMTDNEESEDFYD